MKRFFASQALRAPAATGFAAVPCFAFLLSILPAAPELAAAPRNLEGWLPDDVIGFVKVEEGGKRLREFLASDLRKRLESSTLYRFGKGQAGLEKLEDFLKEVEEGTGRKAIDIADDLLGKEGVVAFRLRFPPEVLVIARSSSPESLGAGIESLKKFVTFKAGGFPEPSRSERSGAAIETFDGKISYAVLGDALLISNSLTAVEEMIDLAKGKAEKSLASSSVFAPHLGREAGAGKGFITAGIRPRFLPNFRLPEKAENPLGSLLLSGWLEALKASDVVVARLGVEKDAVQLRASTTAETEEAGARFASIFFPSAGAEAEGAELAAIEKAGILGYVHIRRDFAQWWENREELMPPRVAGELINFSNVMNVVFGGRSFQDEVLPAFESGFTLVARSLSYEGLPEAPRPQVPGIAAILRLKDAEKFSQGMTSAFQSFVALINIDRMQKQKGGPMLLKQGKAGEVDLYTAAFDLPKDKGAGQFGIEYNFSPSFAVVGSRIILSSSEELARVLAGELAAARSAGGKAPAAAGASSPAADGAFFDAGSLLRLFAANRDLLRDKMQLDEGLTREEADGRMKAIEEIARLLKDLRIRGDRKGRTTTVDLRLGLAGEKVTGAHDGKF